MESIDFVTSLFSDINSFRSEPNCFNKKFENVKITLSRFKGNEALVKDIEQFVSTLNSKPGMATLNLNHGLSKVARKQLDVFEETKKFNAVVEKDVLENRANAIVEGFSKIYQIADSGADNAGSVLGKILFNKLDKEKVTRTILHDESLKEVGLAHRTINAENVFVIVFADKAHEKPQEKSQRSRGDLTELKQAFDMFDVNHIGRIDPKETCAAMRSLGFDIKNPTLFNIMKELDTPENQKSYLDFDTFVNHIIDRTEDTESDDGLRRIFNLFIDDPSQDTITLQTLKKICRELGETIQVEELKDMIERATGNGTELTFEEFSDFMKTKFGKDVGN
jgi:Ca2+-binding EF-hand superfamily protein